MRRKQKRRPGALRIWSGKRDSNRDPNLGKVVLYQLSYSRETAFERRTFSALSRARRKNSGVLGDSNPCYRRERAVS